MYYRTRTYIAGDWDHDKDAVEALYWWNESSRYGLSFSDAHELKQARDTSLNCSIKKSLAERLDASKTFILIVGEHTKENDLVVNVTKSKKLTNMRASGSDEKVSLAPPTIFSLEDALEYIKSDEYVEITPNYMRMRKIILDETERKRQNRN
mgnify:CR=1 FL=1